MGQLFQRLAGPVSVMAFPYPFFGDDLLTVPVAAIAAAVCWQRSSGLLTMASSGSGASLAASAAA